MLSPGHVAGPDVYSQAQAHLNVLRPGGGYSEYSCLLADAAHIPDAPHCTTEKHIWYVMHDGACRCPLSVMVGLEN